MLKAAETAAKQSPTTATITKSTTGIILTHILDRESKNRIDTRVIVVGTDDVDSWTLPLRLCAVSIDFGAFVGVCVCSAVCDRERLCVCLLGKQITLVPFRRRLILPI